MFYDARGKEIYCPSPKKKKKEILSLFSQIEIDFLKFFLLFYFIQISIFHFFFIFFSLYALLSAFNRLFRFFFRSIVGCLKFDRKITSKFRCDQALRARFIDWISSLSVRDNGKWRDWTIQKRFVMFFVRRKWSWMRKFINDVVWKALANEAFLLKFFDNVLKASNFAHKQKGKHLSLKKASQLCFWKLLHFPEWVFF